MDGMCGNINHMHVSTKCPPSVCAARLLCLLHFLATSVARGARKQGQRHSKSAFTCSHSRSERRLHPLERRDNENSRLDEAGVP